MPYDNSPAQQQAATRNGSLEDRLAFFKIDAETKSILAEFYPALESALPDLLAKFYEHVTKWPELVQMFGVRPGGQQVALDRARSAQSSHWLKLFSGRFDEAYQDSARRIGLMHARIGLDPKWYLGGYALTMTNLFAVAIEHYASRFNPGAARQKAARLVGALTRCTMIDMDLAIAIYLEEFYKVQFQNKLNEIASGFETSIGGLITRVSDSSGQLEATAGSMSATAEETSKQVGAVAAASEQASANVQTVASAAEELSSSISEISRQVGQSSKIATQAVADAEKANQMVQGLAGASQKIGDVVALITDIAEQTNLLALNATIEAARAGEAGKGFAVVAAEVKNLANQTAKATDEIGGQITGIQSATQDAVKAIETIGKTIGEINEIASAIAAAVEEQGAATKEIARNVEQAAAGTQEVSSNISGVNQAANDTGSAATQVLTAAQGLSSQSGEMKTLVDTFLAQMRAA